MSSKGFILCFLLLSLIGVVSQSQSFEPGYYYTPSGEKVSGLIKYARSSYTAHNATPGSLRFKSTERSKIQKIEVDDAKAFVLGKDSFATVRNFRISNFDVWFKKDFALVLESGPLTLFLHKSISKEGTRFTYINDRYILLKEGKHFGLWSVNKQRHDLVAFLSDNEALCQKIIDLEYDDDVPGIVRVYNAEVKK